MELFSQPRVQQVVARNIAALRRLVPSVANVLNGLRSTTIDIIATQRQEQNSLAIRAISVRAPTETSRPESAEITDEVMRALEGGEQGQTSDD